ncbi:MliC family protein [Neisseria sp. Dent CA1/247]|uniref:Membrane-bound lysozyme-inhibitor of c-type lysozyme n=1 Tax=Neisseria zoodegmatis TaxID=326523 RepID=A0A378WFE2_9NEIS|nr:MULTISPECIES: MliC family protein [Neisseria]UOO77993.1 MliC family protein [Neisseria sp. Dent CA1/247]SUA36196.1 Membrane-bound lysozyme-inhibitor of c-type lysozyme [Neisseria zoodegmatis]
MSIFKKLAPMALVLLASACVSLEGVEIGGLDNGASSGSSSNIGKFRCDNGYKVLVNYKSENHAVVSFNNGKDTFIVQTYRAPSASGNYFVNDANTLRWHEQGGTAVLTYPDSQYRTTKKLWDTVCRPR